MAKYLKITHDAKLIPKPGKRLMLTLDPRAYILFEPIDKKHPNWGSVWRVYSSDGKLYASEQTPNKAWTRASCKLRYEIVERAARGLGLWPVAKKAPRIVPRGLGGSDSQIRVAPLLPLFPPEIEGV